MTSKQAVFDKKNTKKIRNQKLVADLTILSVA